MSSGRSCPQHSLSTSALLLPFTSTAQSHPLSSRGPQSQPRRVATQVLNFLFGNSAAPEEPDEEEVASRPSKASVQHGWRVGMYVVRAVVPPCSRAFLWADFDLWHVRGWDFTQGGLASSSRTPSVLTQVHVCKALTVWSGLPSLCPRNCLVSSHKSLFCAGAARPQAATPCLRSWDRPTRCGCKTGTDGSGCQGWFGGWALLCPFWLCWRLSQLVVLIHYVFMLHCCPGS